MLWSQIDVDPAVHKIHNVPPVQSLARELKIPNLTSYRHEYTGNWIVGFLSADGHRITEVGPICEVEPWSQWPSKEDMTRLKICLTSFGTKKELMDAVTESANKPLHMRNEIVREIAEANLALYRKVCKVYGQHHADQWAAANGFTYRELCMDAGETPFVDI